MKYEGQKRDAPLSSFPHKTWLKRGVKTDGQKVDTYMHEGKDTVIYRRRRMIVHTYRESFGVSHHVVKLLPG